MVIVPFSWVMVIIKCDDVTKTFSPGSSTRLALHISELSFCTSPFGWHKTPWIRVAGSYYFFPCIYFLCYHLLILFNQPVMSSLFSHLIEEETKSQRTHNVPKCTWLRDSTAGFLTETNNCVFGSCLS